ncbi:TetR/AcrR family transcriptional regulator [Streptomyces sp. Da 82-17]|uniref:TetR/AcrR family transcriptional regulator n=1 Tax=Streptomyces sp. Da 82-17 TaxID=3377116 RepID=UPI0038D432B4
MVRLSRAQLQQLNRAKVLAAARDEFAARGYPGAKVDRIAERAGLTRGAVYSNFPGKRALYFAVLAELAESDAESVAEQGVTGREFGSEVIAETGADAGSPGAADRAARRAALGAFARAWTARLPLAGDAVRPAGEGARLDTHLMSEVLADERTRQPYGQLLKLDALLLGLALETLQPADRDRPAERSRLVRVAESVLTSLHGARQLADAAPGFVEPFTVIHACERLADSAPHDTWNPPHLPYVPHARPVDEPWPPVPTSGGALHGAAGDAPLDAVRGTPARLDGDGDGVLVVLGLHRLEAVEEAVRAAPAGATVTAVLVSGCPNELIPLARLAVADVVTCLRRSFPAASWPRLQLVYDATGSVAAAAGVPAVSDGTEAAVRIVDGRIVARADGRGACHAAATADLRQPAPAPG